VKDGFLQQLLEAEEHSVAPLVLASAAKFHQGREIPDKEERVAKAPVEFVDFLESDIVCDTELPHHEALVQLQSQDSVYFVVATAPDLADLVVVLVGQIIGP
jgi:hypothetical protein